MLGAMIGDIVGSRFEFDHFQSKDFDLFGNDNCSEFDCCFTDDTVMTAAVAEAVMKIRSGMSDEEIRDLFRKEMRRYYKLYPDAGYGSRFHQWLQSESTEPIGSWGNGSAMRVSACGWAARSLEEAERLARLSAEVTHNHPEGIKGAMATAAAIYMCRTETNRLDIRDDLAVEYYQELLWMFLDDIRQEYEFYETSSQTVPVAILAFNEAESFEGTIRNAISMGGDADTLAAIAGRIAEAYYGIPEEIERKAFEFLDDRLKSVVKEFRKRYSEGTLLMAEKVE